MKSDQDFETLMREARAMRLQYIGGLLRRAWKAVFSQSAAIRGTRNHVPAMTHR